MTIIKPDGESRPWLPPAAYRDWRRKQRNAERGESMMREGIARIYAEHNAKIASAPHEGEGSK